MEQAEMNNDPRRHGRSIGLKSRILIFNILLFSSLMIGGIGLIYELWLTELETPMDSALEMLAGGGIRESGEAVDLQTAALEQFSIIRHNIRFATAAFVAIVLAVLIAAIISIHFSLGRMMQPIKTLIRVSRNVALGDFSEHVPVQSRDELGQLNAQFNNMCTQLQKSQSQLVQAETLKAAGEMAAGIAHDFNNVLFAISARLELVHSDLLEDKLQGKNLLQSLEIMMQAARDGADTVRKIREISNPKKSRGLSTLQINELCHQALEMSHDKRKASEALHGCKIKVREIFTDIAPILANPVEIREILTNLINNSVDAMPQGGTLIVSTAEEDDCVRITVADTGEGMDENTKKKVLDPFFTTKGAQGTGLGLSMVYGIVKRMQGEIRIESVPQQGTAVSLFFPIKPGLSLPEQPVEPTGNREALPRHRILVVDDESYVAEGLAGLLRHLGQEADVADSGKNALHMLKKKTYDLVFTDLGMPEMTGWDLIRTLTKDWPDLPVVMVTGWGDYIDEEELLSRSVAEVLSKPVSRDRLHEVLGEVFAKHVDTRTPTAPEICEEPEPSMA